MSIKKTNSKFLGLEASRGVAAILVVLFHAAAIMNLPKYYGEMPLNGFFGFGHAGVDFFFVLSGFIILYVHYGDIGRREQLSSYFTKRFIRIYPIHWIVTTLFIAGLLIFPLTEAPGYDKVIRSFLLLPQEGFPLGVVAWTLIHEVLFYLLFGVLIVNRVIGSVVLLIWSVSVLAGAYFINDHAGYLEKFFFSAHNLEFLLGMSVAWFIRSGNLRQFWWQAGIVGVVIFAMSAWLNSDPSTAPNLLLALYGLGSAFMIYALVCGDMHGALKHPGEGLVFLGAASYSIYLIHFLALSVFIKVFLKAGLNDLLPLTVNYFALVFIAVIIGSLLHLYIEKPTLRWFRNKMLVVK